MRHRAYDTDELHQTDADFRALDGESSLKTTGMARKVDQLGRVVLPAEMRRMFGISEGDLVEIFVDSGRIVLAKVEDQCVFCGTKDDLREFELKRVCVLCVNRLSSADG